MKTQINNLKTQLDPELCIDLYKKMVLIRRVEEMCQQAYDRDKVGGYMHLYNGQEALSAGVLTLLRPDDYICAGYRDHGHCLVLGMPPGELIAEVMGRSGGCSQGKGGSMHLFDKQRNFMGGYGIVGGHTTIGTGAAFAAKYRGTDQIAVCYFGDGALNAGAFHEVANMAALWQLPILYIIENNQYAMGTSLERSRKETQLYKVADAYGFPGKQFEAMDVLHTREVAKEAIDFVRSGNGPMLLEAMTYRFAGHGAADKIALQSYRSQDEVAEWKLRDPIEKLSKQILEEGILTQSEIKAIEDEIRQIAKDAYDWADSSPEPELKEIFTDVYTDMMPEGSDKWQ